MRTAGRLLLALLVGGCAGGGQASRPLSGDRTLPDTVAIKRLAGELAHDSLRGRGPWTPENERAARRLARDLERLGARPLVGGSLLVPFVWPTHPGDTVYNVAGILPGRAGRIDGEAVGVTAHFDHLGVRRPDASGDSIYNGFTDDAIGVAMALDVARRYTAHRGDRPLAVLLFNLEEQGLLGSRAFVERADVAPFLARLQLLVGIDAGTPVGEPLAWQLMGGAPEHAGTRLADSLARSRGWTTTAATPRPISDVFAFSQAGVPILFPIPSGTWRNHSEEQVAEARKRFDHYHQPADEWRADFPMTGTRVYADWVWTILREASQQGRAFR